MPSHWLLVVALAGIAITSGVGWLIWPLSRETAHRRALDVHDTRGPSSRPESPDVRVAELRGGSALLPSAEKAFGIPSGDKDQHGDPVVERNGSRLDPGTGWPYEIWLKEPRIELVLVPPGEFLMESTEDENDRRDDEAPRHPVRLPPHSVGGKYEVTVGQFRSLVDAAHHRTDAEDGKEAAARIGGKNVRKTDASWLRTVNERPETQRSAAAWLLDA